MADLCQTSRPTRVIEVILSITQADIYAEFKEAKGELCQLRSRMITDLDQTSRQPRVKHQSSKFVRT